jgi:threonine aldolase
LYKYLGASAGAVLCGDNKVISKMPHLVKIHGGNQFGNWLNAAMAYHRLQGFTDRMNETVKLAKETFESLNQLPGIKINALDGGTNIYNLQMAVDVNSTTFSDLLAKKYSIRIPRPNPQGLAKISVNETLLYRDKNYYVAAFKDAVKQAS